MAFDPYHKWLGIPDAIKSGIVAIGPLDRRY